MDREKFRRELLKQVFCEQSYFFYICQSSIQNGARDWAEIDFSKLWRSELEQFFVCREPESIERKLKNLDEKFYDTFERRIINLSLETPSRTTFALELEVQAERFVQLIMDKMGVAVNGDMDDSLKLPGENDPELKELIAEITTHNVYKNSLTEALPQ